MRRLLFVAVCIAACCSCSSDRKIPGDVIKPEQMKPIIWDLLTAEQVAASDSTAVKNRQVKEKASGLYETIFAIYHTDKTGFYKSLHYYEAHPPLLKVLMDSVSAYGTRKRMDLYRRKH